MKYLFTIVILFLGSFASFSQTQKEINRLSKEASDTVTTEYVILKSGEKKEISSISISTHENSVRGKVEFADGKKMKLSSGDEIIACYTKEATYKQCSFRHRFTSTDKDIGSVNVSGKSLATRITKAAINIYFLRVSFYYKDRFGLHMSSDVIRFAEGNNNGNLIEFKDEPTVWDKFAQLVSRSEAAMKIIEDIKKKNGKWIATGSIETKLLEAVEIYNKDAEAGKLKSN